MRHRFWLYALALVAVAQGAAAQAPYSPYSGYGPGYGRDKPVQWYIDGGYSATVGRTADFLRDGWTIGTGLLWRPPNAGPLSLRADLAYSRYGATDQLIALGQAQTPYFIDDGNGQALNFDADAVFEVPFSPRVRGYAMAGVGGAWRRIELTQTVGVPGFFCDPWWGFCGGGYVPGDAVVSSNDVTRFAWNAGVGLSIATGYGQSWFVEARYDRIETDRPTIFVPIRVGFRF